LHPRELEHKSQQRISAIARVPEHTQVSTMTVTALLFASYADVLQRESIEFTLPQGSTVSDVVARVRALPGGAMLPPSPLVAVNQEYSRADVVLSSGDEVAIIPPVAGG
jgi:molybdopterin converting factor small subunit